MRCLYAECIGNENSGSKSRGILSATPACGLHLMFAALSELIFVLSATSARGLHRLIVLTIIGRWPLSATPARGLHQPHNQRDCGQGGLSATPARGLHLKEFSLRCMDGSALSHTRTRIASYTVTDSRGRSVRSQPHPHADCIRGRASVQHRVRLGLSATPARGLHHQRGCKQRGLCASQPHPHADCIPAACSDC